jgi:hypothetical protein
MKFFSPIFAVAVSSSLLPALAGPVLLEKRATVKGIDVSGFQGNVDWKTVKAKGAAFAYVKATQSTGKRLLLFLRTNVEQYFHRLSESRLCFTI